MRITYRVACIQADTACFTVYALPRVHSGPTCQQIGIVHTRRVGWNINEMHHEVQWANVSSYSTQFKTRANISETGCCMENVMAY